MTSRSAQKGGTFYLDWSENGKHRTRRAGTTPSEALDAWALQTAIRSLEMEAPEEFVDRGKRLTIDRAIQEYLVDVRATKGERTYKAYDRMLQWFREPRKSATTRNSIALMQ